MYDKLCLCIYMPKLRKLLVKYIKSCPTCAVSKPSHHLPYGNLQAIETLSKPFAIQTMDFIVSLSISITGYNAILTVTDKFTKYLTLVPGKTMWIAKEWADVYFDKVLSRFGLPGVIISDRDPKFTSRF